MKKIIQFFLTFLIILSIYTFYDKYIKKKTYNELNEISGIGPNIQKNINNLIKNLKYEINLNDKKQYIITSKLSEIIYFDDNEVVEMQKVQAKILEEKKFPLIISSDNAEFKNDNYNTIFKNNVLINYINSEISSNNLLIDFQNNQIKIFDNVIYKGETGIIKTDNIIINLNTNEIKMYMDNDSDNVRLIMN